MTKKVTDILSYVTIIGWAIAFYTGNRVESRLALQQGFTLGAASLAIEVIRWFSHILGFVGFIIRIACVVIEILLAVLIVMGIINAVKGEDKPLPVVSAFNFLKI